MAQQYEITTHGECPKKYKVTGKNGILRAYLDEVFGGDASKNQREFKEVEEMIDDDSQWTTRHDGRILGLYFTFEDGGFAAEPIYEDEEI